MDNLFYLIDGGYINQFTPEQFIIAVVVLASAISFQFIPLFLAVARRHPRVVPIALVNLLLGWTGVGWVFAFVWSLSSRADNPQPKIS